jgi:hypothetical protein
MSRRHRLSVLLFIFAVMATLQIALAGRQCLWVDEIFSLAIATGHSLEHPASEAKPAYGDFVEPDQPVEARQLQQYLNHNNPPASPVRVIRAALLSDTSPPLYYLLLYIWTLLFGTSDIALRLFSVTSSLACFPLFAAVARRTGGKAAVIPACILFALSPLGLYFSGEGRMYSLLLFCVVATAWASLVLHQRGGGIAVYAVWILASAAGFLTHYFFVLAWLAMVGFLVLQPGRFERRRLFLCVFIVGLAILPWYLSVARSAGHWRVTQGWLHLHPTGFNRFRAIRNHFLQFFSAGGSGLWEYDRLSSLAATALFGFVAAALAWRFRLRILTSRRLFLVLWFAVVCAAPTAMDLVRHTYVTNNPRYTLAALPAAYLLAAIGLCSLGKRAAYIVLGLILLSWIVPIANIYRLRWRSGEPFRDVAREMSASGSSSNLVLIHSIPTGVLGIARYTDGASPLAAWVQQLGTRRVPESLSALAAGRARILFILAHSLGEPVPEQDWLRANAIVVRETWMDRIKVIEFRPKEAAAF